MHTPKQLLKTLASLSGLAALTLLAGCGGGGSSSSNSGGGLVPQGQYISGLTGLTVTSTGADFVGGNTELGGSVLKPLTADGNGRFSATGTIGIAEGPPPPDGGPGIGTTYPAQYSGKITGTTMTLTITVKPTGGASYTEGPYTLVYNSGAA